MSPFSETESHVWTPEFSALPRRVTSGLDSGTCLRNLMPYSGARCRHRVTQRPSSCARTLDIVGDAVFWLLACCRHSREQVPIAALLAAFIGGAQRAGRPKHRCIVRVNGGTTLPPDR